MIGRRTLAVRTWPTPGRRRAASLYVTSCRECGRITCMPSRWPVPAKRKVHNECVYHPSAALNVTRYVEAGAVTRAILEL